MFNTTEKKERSLGVKLFLKPHRCNSPKCATIRRPHRPGLHGQSRRRQPSEFASQLLEKQKVKFSYGVRDSYLEKIFKRAEKNPKITGTILVALLEKRLDNVLFRLGLAPSRSVARQLIGHGHIVVNKRRVDVPSYQVRVGDLISVREQSKNHPAFKELADQLKTYQPPEWLQLDIDKVAGKVVAEPKDVEMIFDVNLVVDYYSK